MRLRFVIEDHDIQLLTRSVGDGSNRGVIGKPCALLLDALWKKDGNFVTPTDKAVRELEHTSDSAKAAKVRLDEGDTQARTEARVAGLPR
jgi:hypothetical protein